MGDREGLEAADARNGTSGMKDDAPKSKAESRGRIDRAVFVIEGLSEQSLIILERPRGATYSSSESLQCMDLRAPRGRSKPPAPT